MSETAPAMDTSPEVASAKRSLETSVLSDPQPTEKKAKLDETFVMVNAPSAPETKLAEPVSEAGAGPGLEHVAAVSSVADGQGEGREGGEEEPGDEEMKARTSSAFIKNVGEALSEIIVNEDLSLQALVNMIASCPKTMQDEIVQACADMNPIDDLDTTAESDQVLLDEQPPTDEQTPIQSDASNTTDPIPDATTDPIPDATTAVTTSSADTTTPAESASTPAESASTPAESATTPVASATAPAESVTAPEESATAPAESATAPAESTTALAEDAEEEEKSAPAPNWKSPSDLMACHVDVIKECFAESVQDWTVDPEAQSVNVGEVPAFTSKDLVHIAFVGRCLKNVFQRTFFLGPYASENIGDEDAEDGMFDDDEDEEEEEEDEEEEEEGEMDDFIV